MTIILPANGSLDGVSSKLIRLAARHLRIARSASLWDLAVVVGAAPEQVEPLWERLKAMGTIKQVGDRWVPSDLMGQLERARLGKPITRKTADRLLQEFLDNVQRTNEEPGEALYRVVRVAVFGSYLDPARDHLGDLDLAWSLAAKPEAKAQLSAMRRDNVDTVAHMRRLVRPRNSAVRLADWTEIEELQCAYRILLDLRDPS